MKTRKQGYGDRNIIGRHAERIRKERGIRQYEFVAMLQAGGLDINPTSYSKLEGGIRTASDREVLAIAHALSVPIHELFGEEQQS